MLGLVGDAIVAALLIATIVYAALLNARLAVLRGDRAKLEELVRTLTDAAARADAGIAALRAAAEDAGGALEKRIEEGRGLRDDLTYMIERGGLLADRLEGSIRARRDAAAGAAPIHATVPERRREPKLDTAARASASADAKRDAAVPAPSRAERELMRALGGR